MMHHDPSRLGKLPPRYQFMLNPYPELRLSRCTLCNQKTGQRKLPLLIFIELGQPIVLNFTCRFCPACDLLVAHKHEIEHVLTDLFRQVDPQVIGHPYFIVGTVEKAQWRKGKQTPNQIQEVLSHLHDFVSVFEELRVTHPGWYRPDQEPPILAPPPSEEWVSA